MRTIPRIQRGQSASPANGAGIADQQPDRAPTALSGPATGGSDHRGELAAAIAKRRAELLATDSSSAAAELPNSETCVSASFITLREAGSLARLQSYGEVQLVIVTQVAQEGKSLQRS